MRASRSQRATVTKAESVINYISVTSRTKVSAFDYDYIVAKFGEGRSSWLIKYIPFAAIRKLGNRRILTYCENDSFAISWKNPDEWMLESMGPTELELIEILTWALAFANVLEKPKTIENKEQQ